MDEQKSNRQNTDEIDITQVFKWIGKGFKNFGFSIIRGIAGLRQIFISNRLFFGVMVGLAVIVGTVYGGFLKRRYYKTSMILSCDYFNDRIMKNTIEKLNLLSNEKDPLGLAEEIGVDTAVAKNIIGFDYKPFVAEKEIVELEVLKTQLNNVSEAKKEIVATVINKIEIENKRAFQIEVRIFDTNIISGLEKALVNYFGTNPYIRSRVDANKNYLLLRKEKLIRESRKLDSLKSVMYENFQTMARQSRQGSNNVILSDKYLTDPLAIYTQDLDINGQILQIERQLSIRPDFEVIDGFTSFREPDSAGLLQVLVSSIGIAIVLGYILIGMKRFNAYLGTIN